MLAYVLPFTPYAITNLSLYEATEMSITSGPNGDFLVPTGVEQSVGIDGPPTVTIIGAQYAGDPSKATVDAQGRRVKFTPIAGSNDLDITIASPNLTNKINICDGAPNGQPPTNAFDHKFLGGTGVDIWGGTMTAS